MGPRARELRRRHRKRSSCPSPPRPRADAQRTALPWKQAFLSRKAAPGRLLPRGRDVLLDRQRFAGQRGLRDEEVLGGYDAHVGRYDASADRGTMSPGTMSASAARLPCLHGGLRRCVDDQLGFRRGAGAALLEIGEEDADEDHAENDGARAEVAHRVGDYADDQELDRQGVLEAPENLEDEGLRFSPARTLGPIPSAYRRPLGLEPFARGARSASAASPSPARASRSLFSRQDRLWLSNGAQSPAAPKGILRGKIDMLSLLSGYFSAAGHYAKG